MRTIVLNIGIFLFLYWVLFELLWNNWILEKLPKLDSSSIWSIALHEFVKLASGPVASLVLTGISLLIAGILLRHYRSVA